jgi:hypothetical protein
VIQHNKPLSFRYVEYVRKIDLVFVKFMLVQRSLVLKVLVADVARDDGVRGLQRGEVPHKRIVAREAHVADATPCSVL